jgi:hypothetical protein
MLPAKHGNDKDFGESGAAIAEGRSAPVQGSVPRSRSADAAA